MAFSWWAVSVPLPRTGRSEVEYVEASGRQQAGETFPGASVLGGPYQSQAAAAKAFPGGSAGSVTPPAGEPPPVVSDKPTQFPSFSLLLSGISGWFTRGLKLVFGGILMIIGISHLTGLSNSLTRAAGKVAPIAAVAA